MPITIRKATPNRSLRITWPDDTHVNVMFWPKGDAKSQVQLEHAKLPTAEAGERQRAFWKEQLGRLKSLLET